MRLPDICRAGMKTRTQYLSLIGYMARIDGQLDDEEVKLLRKLTNRFEVSDKFHDQIFSDHAYSEAEIEEVFNALKSKNLQYSFILDLIAMAIADGVILEPERMMLAQIAGLIGLPHEEFHNLINFAQVVSNLDEETLDDPMYQYFIDNFFLWARKTDVKLFKQTTFAINDKVDEALKANL